MKIPKIAAQICQALLFPQACVLCARPVLNADFSPLCQSCLDSLRPVTPCVCQVCGVPLPGSLTAGEGCCSDCRRLQKPYDLARAYGIYEGKLKQVIRAFKFERRQRLADPLSRLLESACRRIPTRFLPDWIMPVPLHPSRRKERGFDQTLALGRVLSRRLRIPLSRSLHRVRSTIPQSGLSVEERRRNLRGAFSMEDAHHLRDSTILLLDDVLTTGTTVAEACRLIQQQSEVKSIVVLTIARVPLWRSWI